MSLLQQEEQNYDLGVNPNEIYQSKNLLGKGYISKDSPLKLAAALSVQLCDYENGNIMEDFTILFLQLTGSVDGKKNHAFIEAAGHRVSVNDNQTTISKEGE